MSLRETVIREFEARFGGRPKLLVRAPGRVNLIGEHTDYNDGFVLPMAIDRALYLALRPCPDKVSLVSLDFDDAGEFSLAGEFSKGDKGWLEYVKGTAWAMRRQGFALTGFEGVLAGDVPVGAGLSSSAALEVAVGAAFSALGGLDVSPADIAVLGQTAENDWIGMRCGVMDQMISARGVRGAAVLLDCRSLEILPAPLPEGTVAAVMDTGVRRGLVDSAYNERRRQCEAGAAFFGVPKLRDVSVERITAAQNALDPLTFRRCRYIVMENERTLKAYEALRQNNAAAFGRLMDASHAGMRDEFEISCEALDHMVDCAKAAPGCIGARMTGGGFGGCAVALVAKDEADAFMDAVAACYAAKTSNTPKLYLCRATDGVGVERL